MELTIDQALQKAIEAHKAGQIQEADRLYTAILKAQPKHPDANHNLGVLAVSVGKANEALPFLKAALEANPSIAQFWLSYIDALIKEDRLTDAKVVLDQAKNMGANGDGFDKLETRLSEANKEYSLDYALNETLETNQSSTLDIAIQLRETGKFTQAIDLLKDEKNQFPETVDILAFLSHCYLLADQVQEAKVHLEKARKIAPANASVGWNTARLALKEQKLSEALNIATDTSQRFPDDVEGMGVLGACLRANGKADESLKVLDKAIELNPDYAEALINRGLIRLSQENKPQALADLELAHRLRPHIKQIWDLVVGLKVESQDYSDAILFLINMIEIDPSWQKGFSLLATCNQKVDDSALAVKSFETVLEVKPGDAAMHVNLGIALTKQGETQRAIANFKKALAIKPDYAEAHNIMGNALKDQGKLEEAIEAYGKALAIKPKYAEAHNNMGVTLQEQGKLEGAIEACKKALNIKPDYAEAYYNMGNALQELGKLDEAIEAYKKALDMKPCMAEAHNNMGIALKTQGKLEDAIEAYNKALTIKLDYPEAHNNLGVTLREQGKLQEAIEAYKKALDIKPDYAGAYNNMGVTLQEQGKLEEAIEACKKALDIKPDYAEVLNNLGNALRGFTFSKANQQIEDIIISILDRETIVRPIYISRAALSLIKCQPKFKDLLSVEKSIETADTFEEIIEQLSSTPLLLKLMSVCPLSDLDVERLLCGMRSYIVRNITDITIDSRLLKLQSALALQCFTNEYVYDLSKTDAEALHRLEKVVSDTLANGAQPKPHIILCIASFTALHEYEWSDRLQSNDDIEDVIRRHIKEPNEENALKPSIRVLSEINDEVSSKVREQYEENPYPRWVNLGLRYRPATISQLSKEIKLKLANEDIFSADTLDILIAGCGTGQHSIETKTKFHKSRVLAIDLSLSSLAYAHRKTQELGIHNIDYMQADILQLRSLDRQFDIIESAGVLHHMDDPIVGWELLVDCLRPGGIMNIGLYSELARKPVVEYRNRIAKAGLVATKHNIRSVRATIAESEDDSSKEIRSWQDYYSMSELRDLLFHVREHRFTIPKIKDCLKKLGLEFCGFEAKNIVTAFKASNPTKDAEYDLDEWHIFENDNPSIFMGMYQFWCQKIS